MILKNILAGQGTTQTVLWHVRLLRETVLKVSHTWTHDWTEAFSMFSLTQRTGHLMAFLKCEEALKIYLQTTLISKRISHVAFISKANEMLGSAMHAAYLTMETTASCDCQLPFIYLLTENLRV